MSNSIITKKALAKSLKELMKSIPLNKISVKEIVNNCGLNRQTFYYHFQDIYNLLEWIYETEAVESISQYRSYNTWTDGFQMIFNYIESNRRFCMNTLNSLGKNHLDSYLYTVTYDLIIGVVNEVSQNMRATEDNKKFIANFYTLAFTGLVIQWMNGGMKEDSHKIIEKLGELVEGNFMRALERYEKDA